MACVLNQPGFSGIHDNQWRSTTFRGRYCSGIHSRNFSRGITVKAYLIILFGNSEGIFEVTVVDESK